MREAERGGVMSIADGIDSLTPNDRKRIRAEMRVEIRIALRDLYDKMAYDEASAVGGYQDRTHPRSLDDDWVYDEDR